MAGRWDSKSRSSKGPTALMVRGDAASSAAGVEHLRAVDGVDLRQDLVDREHLAVQQERGTDAAHPGARVLAREQHLRAQVSLGDRQLPLGDAVGGQELELAVDDAQHLVDVLGCRPDHDGQRAGVGVGGPLGPDRVGQATLLAHLLEQPARQPAAQHVVEHGERPAPLVERGTERAP